MQKIAKPQSKHIIILKIIDPENTDIERADIQIDLDRFVSLLPETESFILTRSYGIPVKLSTDEVAGLLGRSRQWVTETRQEALLALQRIDRASNGGLAEGSDAVCVNDLHRMVKLPPVAVPEGISFINGEVVKEKDWVFAKS